VGEDVMTDLRKAAQDLVDRWDTPLWKDAPHTGQYIDALRAALAQPERQPLTDELINVLANAMVKGDKSVNWLCRVIEAEHGIGIEE
jgi:hypothetical protein